MNKANLTPDDKESTITTDDDSSTSNSNLLFTSLDTNSKMVLKHLLDSWDMSTLYEPCIEGHIGTRDLHDINTFVSTWLLKKYTMGIKMDFEQRVKQNRKEQAANRRKNDADKPCSSLSSASNV